MDIETITDEAKVAITGIINRAMIAEYNFILSYPRIIDRLTNYDNIQDGKIIQDLDRLGKESLRHFNEAIKIIERLGGEPLWKLDTIERLDDVEKLLALQLKKEEAALSFYKEARLVASRNKETVKGQDFFGRLIRMRNELAEDIVTADEIFGLLDRVIIDENQHIRLVKDSIATLSMLMNS